MQGAEAFAREALAACRQSVIDALFGAVNKREQAAAQAKRVAALGEYVRLWRLRFDDGYAGYLEVPYAENELFGAELAAVRLQAERYPRLVEARKSSGGGWVEEAARAAPCPAPAAGEREASAGGRER